jgi:prepilin-type N-terminal cleavage/methylation domain-containing protein
MKDEKNPVSREGQEMKGRTAHSLDSSFILHRSSLPRSGYTLFELMLVLAVIATIAAIAYPSIEALYGNYRLTAAVDQVRGVWAAGRAHAMDEGRPYRFAILPSANNYQLAPDSPEFWGGGGSSSSSAQDSGAAADPTSQGIVLNEVVPKGVRLTLSDSAADSGDSSGWTKVAVFLPDGTARDDAELFFQAPGSRAMVLRLRALTGIVTSRTVGQENR